MLKINDIKNQTYNAIYNIWINNCIIYSNNIMITIQY